MESASSEHGKTWFLESHLCSPEWSHDAQKSLIPETKGYIM